MLKRIFSIIFICLLFYTGSFAVRQWLAERTYPVERSFIRGDRSLDLTGEIDEERLRSSILLSPGIDAYHVLLGKYYVYKASKTHCTVDKKYLLEKAGDEYVRALFLNPSYTEILAYLAWVDFSAGRASLAASRLERAIKLDPHNYFNHLFYGICIANFVHTLPPGLANMYLYRAEEEFKRGLELHPGMAGRPAVCIGRAKLHLEKGDIDAAIGQLERIRTIDPTTLPCHLRLADLYLHAGKGKKGIGKYVDLWQNPDLDHEGKEMIIASLSNHARIYPENGELGFLLGRAYVEEGDYDKALEVLQEVVRAEPEKAEAHYLLGRVYEYAGDKKAAYESYERTLRYCPQHPGASERIISMYREMD